MFHVALKFSQNRSNCRQSARGFIFYCVRWNIIRKRVSGLWWISFIIIIITFFPDLTYDYRTNPPTAAWMPNFTRMINYIDSYTNSVSTRPVRVLALLELCVYWIYRVFGIMLFYILKSIFLWTAGRLTLENSSKL